MRAFLGQLRRAARLAALCTGVVLVAGVASARLAPVAGASDVHQNTTTSLARVAAADASRSISSTHRKALVAPDTNTVTCLFDGQSDQTIIENVTPGSSITMTCTGFQPSEQVFATEGSPLFFQADSDNDLDPNGQTFMSDSSGDLSATFVVPNPFVAANTSAVCPPSASQVAAGYLRCFVVVADEAGNGDVGALNYAPTSGYWMVGSDGGVFAFGTAPFVGSLPADHVHVDDIVAVVPTADDKGYWMVGADGGVFAFGDAGFVGSLPADHVHVNNIVAVVPTADDEGYWMVGSDGGAFAFGDARYLGSLPADKVHINDIVAVVPTNDGGGYWMVGSDGGVFAFGDAGYLGSLPGDHINVSNVVAVVPTPDGGGYWMASANGRVFPFGDAKFFGSLPADNVDVNNIVAVVPTIDGGGYWMVGSDGGVFAFGDAGYLGSLPADGVHVNNVVAVVRA